MAFAQVEEYFVWFHNLNLSDETIEEIKSHLSEEAFDEYELTKEELTVDGVPSEHEADTLNDELTEIINKGSN